MKKIYILFIAFVISLPGLSQRVLDLSTLRIIPGECQAIPSRSIEKLSDGLLVTYYLDRITLCDDELYQGALSPAIEGFWPNRKSGEPMTLGRWDTFLVPGRDVEYSVTDSSFVEFPLELSPARPVLLESSNESYTRNNVPQVRDYPGRYPSSLVSARGYDSYRGHLLSTVCVNPVQYDYRSKTLRVFTKIQYKVRYQGTEAQESAIEATMNRDNETSRYLQNVTLNGALYKDPSRNRAAGNAVADNYSYLIISVPKYEAAVNRLAEWKRTLGYDVHTVIQQSWNPTTVKSAVTNAYNTYNIESFLIIGNNEDVPAEIHHYTYSNKIFSYPTDLYYGCMNANSHIPDITRGRIPVSTLAEAETVVDKIIRYEYNPPADEKFYKTGLHCAYFQDNDSNRREDWYFTYTSERIRNRMLSVLDSVHRVYYTEQRVPPTYWRHGVLLNGDSILPPELLNNPHVWEGNKDSIANRINSKTLYALYRGHGLSPEWYLPKFNMTDFDLLENGNCQPVVFSISCKTGSFDKDSCFCRYLLKMEDGGCIAAYGASQSSFSPMNDVLSAGMFNAIWPSSSLLPQLPECNGSYSTTPQPTFRLGQILDQGLRRTDEAFSPSIDSICSVYTFELFHCFGDPTMMIYTAEPSEFSGASIVRENGTITVSTGGETARISYYNRRTGQVEAYLGTSHTHADDPEISVSISAHNKRPFIDGGILFIQNQTLAGDSYHSAGKIMVGNHVTDTQTQGNVYFTGGRHRLAAKETELHPGTEVSLGAELEVLVE